MRRFGPPATGPRDSDSAARRRERRGWYFYDWANSAFSTTVVTVFLGPYLITLAEAAANDQGRVQVLLWQIRPGAYFSWVVSASVVLQVLVLPLMGAVADRSAHKKRLLGALAFLGAGATMAMVLLEGERYQLGGVLLIVANLCFGASIVVYNSFLPQIATPDERDAVSSRGWALGYLGGATLLLANLALYLGHETVGLTKEQAVRVALFSAGLWWAAFTVIPLRRLRDRPVPVDDDDTEHWSGVRQVVETLRQLRRLPQTARFLVAYLLYNDGIQTVIALAAVYIEKELLLGTGVAASVILLVQLVAFAGALVLGRVAGRWGAHRVVLATLGLWSAVVLIAVTLPVGRAMPVYLLAAAIGFVLGGSQALSRSLYSQMVPRGREAEFFSFYEIAERGTSWVGTAAFGIAFELTGNYRSALLVLLAFFVVGGGILATVRVQRAILDAGNPLPRVV